MTAEDGMCLIAGRTGGGISDYIEGDIRRIDLQNGVVINTTLPLAQNGCWPRFSPDGDQFAYMDGTTVRIRNLDGGAVRSFAADDHGNISWTGSGIWVSGDGRITKYDTNGVFIKRYTQDVVRRNYVSQNEITGAGVSEGTWYPVIYSMRRSATVFPAKPPGASAVGCSACPSPDGTMITNNLVENTIDPTNPAEVHRSMRILDTLGNMLLYIRLEEATKFNQGYRWDTQCWSGSSNDWICIPVGQGSMVADRNVSPCIYNIRTKEKYCLRDNSNTSDYWQPYDYYSGTLPSGTGPGLQLSPASLNFVADSGAGNPPVQTVTASTSTGSLRGVSFSGQPGWLAVTPASDSGSSISITNAATVADMRVGVYRDTITVTTTNAGSRAYPVTLTIRTPTVQSVLTSVTVTPPVFTIDTGASITFLATPRDQVGAVMKGVAVTWSVSGGGTISTSGVFAAAKTVGGAFRVIAAVSAGGATIRDTAFIDVSTRSAVHRKIDCGANTPSVSGWERDDPLVTGGGDWTNPGTVSVSGIGGAAPANVYKSARRGSPHSYAVAGLPPGMYTVRLHRADAVDSIRRMSYTIQGVNVLRDFSIAGAAGGINKALVMDFPADLRSGGNLTVLCEGAGGSDVLEAGLEIIEDKSTAITLLSPDGGQGYAIGQTVPVQWYADTVKIAQVYVELSVDDGILWALICRDQGIMLADRTQWGNYQWTIPDSVNTGNGPVSTVSQTCRVRIRPYFLNTGVSPAISESVFAIGGSGIAPSSSRAGMTAFTRPVVTNRGFMIRVSARGPHAVTVLAVNGAVVLRRAGVGPACYALPRGAMRAGLYAVEIDAEGGYMRSVAAVAR